MPVLIAAQNMMEEVGIQRSPQKTSLKHERMHINRERTSLNYLTLILVVGKRGIV